jgi:protein phosphatase
MELGLALVADGMGGYACGEVASSLVRDCVYQGVKKGDSLLQSIEYAQSRVLEEASSDPAKSGMGSTVIAARFEGDFYTIAWVGDSRAYLWSPQVGELRQISKDHSYVESLVSAGAISHEQALSHPERNIITQAVGAADTLVIDQLQGRLGWGQLLLMCSDGLVDEVLDAQIAGNILAAESRAIAVERLVTAAVTAGGRDNITVVIVAGGESEAINPETVRATFVSAESGVTTQSDVRAEPGVSIRSVLTGEGDSRPSVPLSPVTSEAQRNSPAGFWQRLRRRLQR